MNLNLHSGVVLVAYDALRESSTPEATASHVPVEHHRLVDLVRGTLAMYGHEIVEEHHALDKDGMAEAPAVTSKLHKIIDAVIH
jgi:hypothetical protein